MTRTGLALALGMLSMLTGARAMADCTGNACSDSHPARAVEAAPMLSESAQRATDYLDLWVTRRVLLLRLGAQHPDVIAAQARLVVLHRALPARTRENEASVLAWLRFAHAETEARLAEMGSRCGPQHIDLRGAELRRDALRGLIEALLRGDALALPTA